MKRSSLPKRSGYLKRSRVKRVNPKRKASEFARCYHSKERVEFVKRLPCAACGIAGYSENAHVGKEGKGAGRKGNADQIAPLCGWSPDARYAGGRMGCHAQFDNYRGTMTSTHPHFNPVQAAADCEAAWQAHIAGTQPTEPARRQRAGDSNG